MGAAIPIIAAIAGLGGSLFQAQAQRKATKRSSKVQKTSIKRQDTLIQDQRARERKVEQEDEVRRRRRRTALSRPGATRRATILTGPLGIPDTGQQAGPRTLLGA